jgi:hypothetical protein
LRASPPLACIGCLSLIRQAPDFRCFSPTNEATRAHVPLIACVVQRGNYSYVEEAGTSRAVIDAAALS